LAPVVLGLKEDIFNDETEDNELSTRQGIVNSWKGYLDKANIFGK